VQNTATIEHIRDKSDMKVGPLSHLTPVLLEEAKCDFDYTVSSFVPFVKATRLAIRFEGDNDPIQ
jgi:hypothetical protein